MKSKILSILTLISLPLLTVGAVDIGDIGFGREVNGSILSGDMTLVGFLSLVQSLLLKVILPILIVGTTLYIAYQLFTAEGDETKMKNAWRSLTFSGIALAIIALAYALVAIFSRIAL